MEQNTETFPTKIFIARRGDCAFVEKVRNAEKMGASLLVVVDNKAENITAVIMGDNGTGAGLRIPAMLIGKSDGERLIEFAMSKGVATLSAEFSVKEKGSVADIELWYSSNNQKALDFIKEFDKYAHKLSGYMTFRPRFVTWACTNCAPEFKKAECFGDGQYCAPNHIKDDFHRINGKDIIYEDLRQACLHRIMDDANKEPKWWDYMKEVHS